MKLLLALIVMGFAPGAFADSEDLIYRQRSVFGNTFVFEAETARHLKCNFFYHQIRSPRSDYDAVFVQRGLNSLTTSRSTLNRAHPAVLALGRRGFSFITADRPGIIFGGDKVSHLDAKMYDEQLPSDSVDCGVAAVEWSLKHSSGKIHFLGFSDGGVTIALILKRVNIPVDRMGLVVLQGAWLDSWQTFILEREKREGDLKSFTSWIKDKSHEGELREFSGAASTYWDGLRREPSGESVLSELAQAKKVRGLVFMTGSFDPAAPSVRNFEKKMGNTKDQSITWSYYEGGHSTTKEADFEMVSRVVDFANRR